MKPFIDIVGASGATYRFWRIEGPAELPARSGNFLFVRPGIDGEQVVYSGTALNLEKAGQLWSEAVEAHHAASIFVRYNVARSARALEHHDIVEGHKPAIALADFD